MFQCLKLFSGSFTAQSQLTSPSFMFLKLGTAVANIGLFGSLLYELVQQSTRQTHRRRALNQRCLFLYSVFVALDSRQWQRAVFTYSWRIVQTCVILLGYDTSHKCTVLWLYVECVFVLFSVSSCWNELSNTKHVKTNINIDLNNLVWIESRLEISL